MEEIFKNYEKTIKKKHRVNFTPKFKEEFRTNVSNTLFVVIAEKTIERLGWDLIDKDENSIEAERIGNHFLIEKRTESITAHFEKGYVTVISESLGNEIWDMGHNSKRVKLFIYAFNETLNLFDREALIEIENEEKRKNNWDDYVIPEILPIPTKSKTPNFLLPIFGGLVVSLTLGFLVAIVSVKVIYLIFLFEFLVASAMVFVMKHLIKHSNFTDFTKLQFLLAAMILLTYSSNQYFQYELILNELDFERIGFWQFMKMRFTEGFMLKTINTGSIGLVISWVIQLGLTGLFVYIKIITALKIYVIERVPTEVLDFAFYHFVKGKSEDDVRRELSKKGWNDTINQDEVFEAIGAL